MNQIRKKKTRTIEESLAENAYNDPDAEIESDSSDDDLNLQPQKPSSRVGRKADPILAVQAPRPWHRVQVRDLRQLQLLGKTSLRKALPGVATRLWHEVSSAYQTRFTSRRSLPSTMHWCCKPGV
jgi:hypothetical protein